MFRSRKSLSALVALLVGLTASAAEYAPGEVIVKYKADAVRTRGMMESLYNSAGVARVKRLRGIMKGFEQLSLNDNVKVEDAIAQLQKDPTVEYAQPNYILRALPIAKYDGSPFPGLPGGGSGGGGLPCIPGMQIPGCDPNGGGGGGGGGLPLPGGGGNGGGGSTPCLIPGLPFPPGCQDNGGGGGGVTPPPGDGGGNPPSAPAERPALQDPPADVNPPVADPDLDKAWGLSKIAATDAWKEWRGSKDFIVADIDTGIDYNHEDLSFNVWRNPHPDADKKDIVGFDFIHNDGLPFDDNEHGTHTAGTIGAVGGNGIGVSGVAQRVSLMALKFLTGDGSGTTADAIRAIDYAIGHGAKVLSNSWGGKGDDNNQALHDAIERARAKDVLFVAAAGNDGTDNDGRDPSYPAAFDNDNLISVAATDTSDGMAFFSNYGLKTTHVAAPGVDVYSTVPGNKYAQLSGTSMACPHVAGAAALLWSKHPEWNYKKVKEVLMNTVDKLPALEGKIATGGRINILKALRSKE